MKLRDNWMHVLAGILGGAFIALGLRGLSDNFSVGASFLSVLGFLIAGWAVFDYRRFRPGTPESELDGGRTIE